MPLFFRRLFTTDASTVNDLIPRIFRDLQNANKFDNLSIDDVETLLESILDKEYIYYSDRVYSKKENQLEPKKLPELPSEENVSTHVLGIKKLLKDRATPEVFHVSPLVDPHGGMDYRTHYIDAVDQNMLGSCYAAAFYTLLETTLSNELIRDDLSIGKVPDATQVKRVVEHFKPNLFYIMFLSKRFAQLYGNSETLNINQGGTPLYGCLAMEQNGMIYDKDWKRPVVSKLKKDIGESKSQFVKRMIREDPKGCEDYLEKFMFGPSDFILMNKRNTLYDDYVYFPVGFVEEKDLFFNSRHKDWVPMGDANKRIALYESYLDRGFALCISLPVIDNWYGSSNVSQFDPPDEKSKWNRKGGHVMVIVGYEPNQKHFIVKNSWGASSGDKGYVYMSYEWIARMYSEPQFRRFLASVFTIGKKEWLS